MNIYIKRYTDMRNDKMLKMISGTESMFNKWKKIEYRAELKKKQLKKQRNYNITTKNKRQKKSMDKARWAQQTCWARVGIISV